MLLDSFSYLDYLKLDHCYLLPISLSELFVSSHGGTMTISLMHQWHDTICGGVIGPRRRVWMHPSPVNDGFDVKAMFNMYITKRINDKSLELLESIMLYKTSDEFRIVISRLPEYYMPVDKVLSDTKGVWNKILEKHTRPGYTYWTKLKNVGNRLCCNAKVRYGLLGLIGHGAFCRYKW
ncbi:hypothetical protein Tco_0965726 [Tanacetum coccineum]